MAVLSYAQFMDTATRGCLAYTLEERHVPDGGYFQRQNKTAAEGGVCYATVETLLKVYRYSNIKNFAISRLKPKGSEKKYLPPLVLLFPQGINKDNNTVPLPLQEGPKEEETGTVYWYNDDYDTYLEDTTRSIDDNECPIQYTTSFDKAATAFLYVSFRSQGMKSDLKHTLHNASSLFIVVPLKKQIIEADGKPGRAFRIVAAIVFCMTRSGTMVEFLMVTDNDRPFVDLREYNHPRHPQSYRDLFPTTARHRFGIFLLALVQSIAEAAAASQTLYLQTNIYNYSCILYLAWGFVYDESQYGELYFPFVTDRSKLPTKSLDDIKKLGVLKYYFYEEDLITLDMASCVELGERLDTDARARTSSKLFDGPDNGSGEIRMLKLDTPICHLFPPCKTISDSSYPDYKRWLYRFPLPSPRLDYAVGKADAAIVIDLVEKAADIINQSQFAKRTGSKTAGTDSYLPKLDEIDVTGGCRSIEKRYIYQPAAQVYPKNSETYSTYSDVYKRFYPSCHYKDLDQQTVDLFKTVHFTITKDQSASEDQPIATVSPVTFYDSLLTLLYGEGAYWPTLLHPAELRMVVMVFMRRLQYLGIKEIQVLYPWLKQISNHEKLIEVTRCLGALVCSTNTMAPQWAIDILSDFLVLLPPERNGPVILQQHVVKYSSRHKEYLTGVHMVDTKEPESNPHVFHMVVFDTGKPEKQCFALFPNGVAQKKDGIIQVKKTSLVYSPPRSFKLSQQYVFTEYTKDNNDNNNNLSETDMEVLVQFTSDRYRKRYAKVTEKILKVLKLSMREREDLPESWDSDDSYQNEVDNPLIKICRRPVLEVNGEKKSKVNVDTNLCTDSKVDNADDGKGNKNETYIPRQVSHDPKMAASAPSPTDDGEVPDAIDDSVIDKKEANPQSTSGAAPPPTENVSGVTNSVPGPIAVLDAPTSAESNKNTVSVHFLKALDDCNTALLSPYSIARNKKKNSSKKRIQLRMRPRVTEPSLTHPNSLPKRSNVLGRVSVGRSPTNSGGGGGGGAGGGSGSGSGSCSGSGSGSGSGSASPSTTPSTQHTIPLSTAVTMAPLSVTTVTTTATNNQLTTATEQDTKISDKTPDKAEKTVPKLAPTPQLVVPILGRDSQLHVTKLTQERQLVAHTAVKRQQRNASKKQYRDASSDEFYQEKPPTRKRQKAYSPTAAPDRAVTRLKRNSKATKHKDLPTSLEMPSAQSPLRIRVTTLGKKRRSYAEDKISDSENEPENDMDDNIYDIATMLKKKNELKEITRQHGVVLPADTTTKRATATAAAATATPTADTKRTTASASLLLSGVTDANDDMSLASTIDNTTAIASASTTTDAAVSVAVVTAAHDRKVIEKGSRWLSPEAKEVSPRLTRVKGVNSKATRMNSTESTTTKTPTDKPLDSTLLSKSEATFLPTTSGEENDGKPVTGAKHPTVSSALVPPAPATASVGVASPGAMTSSGGLAAASTSTSTASLGLAAVVTADDYVHTYTGSEAASMPNNDVIIESIKRLFLSLGSGNDLVIQPEESKVILDEDNITVPGYAKKRRKKQYSPVKLLSTTPLPATVSQQQQGVVSTQGALYARSNNIAYSCGYSLISALYTVVVPAQCRRLKETFDAKVKSRDARFFDGLVEAIRISLPAYGLKRDRSFNEETLLKPFAVNPMPHLIRLGGAEHKYVAVLHNQIYDASQETVIPYSKENIMKCANQQTFMAFSRVYRFEKSTAKMS